MYIPRWTSFNININRKLNNLYNWHSTLLTSIQFPYTFHNKNLFNCSPINPKSKIVENLNKKRILITKKWLNPRPTFTSFTSHNIQQLFKQFFPNTNVPKNVLCATILPQNVHDLYNLPRPASSISKRPSRSRNPSPIANYTLVSRFASSRDADGPQARRWRTKEEREREREGVRHVNLFKHNRSGTRSTRTPPVWEVRRCFTIKVRNGGRTRGLFRHDPLSPLCRFFPCAPPPFLDTLQRFSRARFRPRRAERGISISIIRGPVPPISRYLVEIGEVSVSGPSPGTRVEEFFLFFHRESLSADRSRNVRFFRDSAILFCCILLFLWFFF